ncbi:exodeoxyribonuclease V subunit alpha [Leptospira sp. 201903070]|uniref:RecBCD enzyme subunit RecD n=1 Tax=Leptospira ainlahdjerensis TaxID=2810033 RepID=A0ABS2U6V9_9LEPT|nr:exodeoxyribonuclease V subunit alpha [Leptospira ainlahdjerensis]MBM9575874.1 exodeoxyribonuclease V subunit alpha [Leptospira ainlahdjerensis]
MEELFPSWTTKLKEDILALTELESKKKTNSKFSEETPDSLLEILNELWKAGEDGNLCIPVRKEWKNFLRTKPPALIVEKIGNTEWIFFEKTFRTKTELETRLHEIISETVRLETDLEKADRILKTLESKSFPLKKGQVRSICSCLSSSFQIISGGPGTGKTTVVAFLLQILNELGELPPPDEIALVAPTGRAAQRLTESIQENLKKISNTEENSLLRGQTIHGLLSYKHSLGGFYYNQERYLPHRLIIVDEVSMVDLNLMLSLFQALPKNSSFRLILIGDPNQLPSVEKGAVLSDFLSILESEKGTYISKLEESNRQKKNAQGEVSQIVTLAEEILKYAPENLNLGTKINDTFPKTKSIGEEVVYESQVVWLQKTSAPDQDVLTRDEVVELLWEKIFLPQISRIGLWKVKDGTEFTDFDFIRTFQRELGRFRCLTVFRNGYWGVESIQSKIINLAAQDLYGRITSSPSQNLFPKRLAKRLYFVGLPVLITQNDKSRKLFNGDIGLVLRIGDTGELRAVFPIENRLYSFALDTLPEHEPAFVMSIHKSQGSEYDTILIYLPDRAESAESNSQKLLNRQILYTGITRAKNQVILAGNPKTWELGIENVQKRNTGFRWNQNR